MPIIIIGAGIIGLSTAYHLLELGCTDPIEIIEASSTLFSGASGYSGGFLASDWYSRDVLPLGRLSFALHKELATNHEGRKRWGYAPSTGVSLGGEYPEDKVQRENGADWLLQGTSRAEVASRTADKADATPPDWLRVGKDQTYEVMSSGDSTAQVDPYRLCSFLLEHCKSAGVKVHHPASVTRLRSRAGTHSLEAVELDHGAVLPASKIVLTAGPWTSRVFDNLFTNSKQASSRLRVGALAGHSIVVRSPHWAEEPSERAENELGCHAVFATSFEASTLVADSVTFAPEIFSRHPNEIYIAGLNSSTASLPDRAEDSKINDKAIAALKHAAGKMLRLRLANDLETEVQVVRAGHCFRPTTPTGRPYIARIPDADLAKDCTFEADGGVWISAGHGPWGISLSQGTGRVLAELIIGQKPSVDMRPFAL